MKNLNEISAAYPNFEKFKKAFVILTNLIIDEGWAGACHASTGILYAVAKKLGIPAELCIGEAALGPIVFDHSWLLIDGKVYDCAIAVPLNPECSCAPVFAGVDLETGAEPPVEYGVFQSGLGGRPKWPTEPIFMNIQRVVRAKIFFI